MTQDQSVVKRHRWVPWVALVPVVIVLGLAGALIGSSLSSASSTTSSSCNVTAVADNVLPSVVTISASGSGTSGTGSGEVIRSDGHILTNNHVIAKAAVAGGSVQVLFADGTPAEATIVGRDPQTDLAVVKVSVDHPLPVIDFGSSRSTRVGDSVVVLGAPLGLSGTVTSGIVSARDRIVEVPGDPDPAALLVSALQTDAAINPGNSGGAMVDCSGRLIGVPTAGANVPSASAEGGGSIGLGFAIPFDFARPIYEQIIATGRVRHAYFGLQTSPIPASAARRAGVPGGLFVSGILPGGPAAQAGLDAGDVINSIDGAPAVSNQQLDILSLTKAPGESVPLTYLRGGERRDASITLAAQP
jgi:putative serine protease PepD